MAAKVHFNQMKYPVMKRRDRGVAECIYQNEINKVDVTEKYEKSIRPESGYMTDEEYEELSRAKNKKDIVLTGGETPKDSNMVYFPEKTFKLVKYNDPIGSPELSLPRKLNFDRQINAQGIVSGDKTIMVYPAVYYYAESDCTSCDLFLIELDTSMSDTEKVMKANIINRNEEPILSTSKDTETKFVFRTLTPIDFSGDNKKLAIKEKIGHRHDGIWKTELWVYDFENKKAVKLPQVRDAIAHYWQNESGSDIENNRWDIYPLGFHADDDNRVVVCAYAYTGEVPKFLGTWSVAANGEDVKLESLENSDIPIAVVGYRLAEDSVKDASEVEFEARQAKAKEKAAEKETKNSEKFDKKIKKIEYQRKIEQMDMETLMKIRQRKQEQKELKQELKELKKEQKNPKKEENEDVKP